MTNKKINENRAFTERSAQFYRGREDTDTKYDIFLLFLMSETVIRNKQ